MERCTQSHQADGPADGCAGYADGSGHVMEEPPRPSGPVPAWMTPALIADTIRVYSPLYGRALTEEDAVEILTNIKHYAEVMLLAAEEAQP